MGRITVTFSVSWPQISHSMLSPCKENYTIVEAMKKYALRFRSVDKPTFDAIQLGTKSIETRAATTKYYDIKPGDVLVFSCRGENFEKKVKDVQHFDSIEVMLKTIDLKKIMPEATSLKEAENIYYSFPGYKEKIAESGLLAFSLE
jgi:ASC-1-like (ASCH) protein